jgi:hypothetical protein
MRHAVSIAIAAAALAAAARADVTQPPPPATVGATELARITPAKGFVDDPIAFDGARVAYIDTDGATFTELVVYDPATKAEVARAALPADLGTPTLVRWIGTGDAAKILVAGKSDEAVARAALLGVDGKVVRKFGPATDVALVTRGGQLRLALHREKTTDAAKGVVHHEVELVELDKGKRVGKLRTLDVGADGKIEKLDFRINHWTDGFTHAIGVKGGHWDPKENQRTPDVAADYDVVDAAFKTTVIDDPMAFAHRARVMADRPAGAVATFARMSDDLTTVELWRDGAPQNLDLDQPVAQYDPQTLGDATDDKGALWIALEIDPTNPAAVKRKKADPAYIDLFAVDAATGKAVRKARVLAAPKKEYRWGTAGGRWWLLERSVGFDRGGTSLAVYSLQS